MLHKEIIMKKHTKGDGVFKERAGKIYVHGTINGKFYRKSTGKNATSINKAWLKKQDPLKVLSEILGISNSTTKTSLKDIGIEAIEIQNTAKKITNTHHRDKINAFKSKILPHFEHIPLEEISVKNIINWINFLKEQYSFTHVKFIKNLFKSIFNYAKNDLRLIDYNPFESEIVNKIDLSWNATTETYTTKEVEMILTNSIGWFKVFIDLSCKYGLRPSETISIKWEDINFDNGLLYLKRSKNVDNVIVEHENAEGNKNHFRTIPLFESTVRLLKNYFEVRLNKIWVFVNKDNKPFTNSQSIIDYHLKPLLEELNIKYKTLYALRRSYASIMNHAGQNLEDIQKVMGHSEGSVVTEKHYITEDILTVEDRKQQSKSREALFNSVVKS
jgi:integrase